MARLSVALLACVVAPLLGQTPDVCGVPPDGAAAAYLHLSAGQMKKELVELHGLKPAEDGDADAILRQTSTVLGGMLAHVPNLLAQEQLSQRTVALPYVLNEAERSSGAKMGASRSSGAQQMSGNSRALEGQDLEQALDEMLTTSSQQNRFLYRVTSVPDPVLGHVLEESRTNEANEAVMLSSRAGSPHGIGFSKEWLMFIPANLPQLRLRFLGRQKIDGRETLVVAFAQIPGKVSLPAEIQTGAGSCTYFTQGVVWIDRDASQIVRLRTDLQAPIEGIGLQRMRTGTQFSEVKIEGANLSLWMPAQTEILWATKANAGGELHRYSGYRLFSAKVTLRPAP
ncbi:hypothetical protein [Granulicella rosea]|uniref:hypothetical protein n=1 Tax=Granulicella rosea TaxID=474952 RepID=UPI00115F46B8|nr:hypothetical protein [Granulicella rosea]